MDSLNIRPPFFGQRQPDYPVIAEIIRVTTATVPGPSGYGSSSFLGPVLYVGSVCQLVPSTLLPRDRFPCLADDLNGLGLAPGYYTNARLSGSFNGLPVYSIGAAGTAGGGLTTGGTGGGPATPVQTLPGLTINQYNNLIRNLSPAQISNLNNLNACQLQTFLTLNTSQQQILTGTLTSTQISNLVSTLTSTQLSNLVSTLSVNQLQQLTNALNPIQIQQLVQTMTASQIATVINSLSTAQIQALANPSPYGRTPIADTDYTSLASDKTIAYTSITTARTVTLPLASAVPPGFQLSIQDESGSASNTNTISVKRTGSDTVDKAAAAVPVINTAFTGASVESDGVSNWTVRGVSLTGLGAPAVGYTTGDTTNGSPSYVGVTGLSFPIAANEVWAAEFNLYCTGNTNGMTFQVTGPASPTFVRVVTFGNTTGVTAYSNDSQTAFSSPSAVYMSGAFNGMVIVKVAVQNGSNSGTVAIQFNANPPSGNVKVLQGSYLSARKVG